MAGSPDDLFLDFQLAVAGTYSIVRELGRGGMGVVYLAREVHLDRFVAIKVLPPGKAAGLKDGFLREARLAAGLSHPHVVPIHAVDEVGGFVFYVMAFVEGESLAERVRTRGPMSAGEGARVLREVAWALAYAHSQGVVHRDVKPDNILLETASGRALVADFGIATIAGDASRGDVAGTPEFMSPEQALGHDVDARSDIYALGATGYYALTGRVPFDGGSATEVLARHVSELPTPLATLGVSVPRRLAAVVERCLAKDPSARPADASALADELGVTLDQRRELPVALRAFVRRNGRMGGAGTLLYGAALLVTSVAFAATLGVRAAVATLAVGAVIAPAGFAVLSARRLVRLGFAHADLAPAFRVELERAKEEREIDSGPLGRTLERLMAACARVCASYTTIALPTIALALALPGARERALTALPVTLTTAAIGFGAGIGYLVSLQRRRDIDTEMWSALWRGRFGTLAFAIARRLRRGPVPSTAMTHRATELSLGMAAEQLYDALPRETRQALGDLPTVLSRLQRDARLLRERAENLAPPKAWQGAGGSLHDELRAERELIAGRLTDVVGALETIRLNLLRLHADTSALPSVTTYLDVAQEVSLEVERLLAARGDVDESLRFPHALEPTPV